MTRWLAGAAIIGAATIIGSKHDTQVPNPPPNVTQSDTDYANEVARDQPLWRPGQSGKEYCQQVERYALSMGVPQDGISCGVEEHDYIVNGRWVDGNSG